MANATGSQGKFSSLRKGVYAVQLDAYQTLTRR